MVMNNNWVLCVHNALMAIIYIIIHVWDVHLIVVLKIHQIVSLMMF